MKNILVLAPTPSHPQDAGNRKRIYALTKYLQELGSTIYFVYCPREWDREIPQDSYEGMKQCWDYFFVSYPVQRSIHQTNDEYFKIDAWWDVGIEFTINWIKLAVDIDMVLCNYVFYSKALELFDESVTKVIDTHDIVSNRNYLLEKKLGYRDFFFTSPKSEQQALDRAHLILSIKEDESSWFKCLSSTPVLTIGHLEPEPEQATVRAIDYRNIRLGFIGSANPINCKNLESFLDEYLTLYGEHNEQFTFVVGGKVCKVLNQRFHDRVHLLGMVDDVAEFYEQVDIVVLPFEFSTGLKIKTVEALSWDKPCIGTINAFEGLGSSCYYHSFESIKNLAHGIKDLVLDPQGVIAQLSQDSESVRTSYADQVKGAIKKLYNVNWQSVKELQTVTSLPTQEDEIEQSKIYNFNLVTNVDFWKSSSNEALWINFWIKHARKLGNINIFRTERFSDIAADKQTLYRLGLVNNVHHRELYQIFDLFKIAPDEDQIFIDLLDFSSIVKNLSCLSEIEQMQLAENHFFWCFLDRLSDNANHRVKEYAIKMLENSDRQLRKSYLWSTNSSLIPESNSVNSHLKLLEHFIEADSKQHWQPSNLEQIVIGTSCTSVTSLARLKKLVFCCQNFLPANFELAVISNLQSVKNNYANVHSPNDAHELIPRLDLFVCLENPHAISFLIYLCMSRSTAIFYKDREFTDTLTNLGQNLAVPINSFTAIPEIYKQYLETSAFKAKSDSKIVRHPNWQLFIERCLMQTSPLPLPSSNNPPQLASKI